MAKEINLLPVEAEKKKEERTFIGKLRLVGVGLLVFTMVLVVGLLIGAWVLVAVSGNVGRQIANTKETVTSHKEREILLRMTKDKVTGIEEVFSNRRDFPSFLKKLTDIIPPEATLVALSVGKEGKASVTVRVFSTETLKKYLESIKAFKGVVVGSVMANKSEGYKILSQLDAF